MSCLRVLQQQLRIVAKVGPNLAGLLRPTQPASFPCLAAPAITILQRELSSFNRKSADQIWKGMLSVSNAGRRRGRGRGAGKKNYKDLNRGQMMGIGEKNFMWPGLNAPIMKGSEVIQQQELAPDPKFKENMIKIRDAMEMRKRAPVHPLSRGWSGTKMLGKWIGPPDPIHGEEFVGFDSIVLVVKPIFYMKPNFGRTKKLAAIVVTGNGNGLVGYGVGWGSEMRTAINTAKNKAGQRVISVQLDKDSIVHDFYSRFGHTKVFAEKKRPGFGLEAPSRIRAICQVVGIKDIKVKLEGAQKNYLNLTRAFILGLLNQKSFQQMADEKGLHVVENVNGYPHVLASPAPEKERTAAQISPDENLDFQMFLNDGKVIETVKLKPMYYTQNKGWRNYNKKWNYRKLRERVRIDLIAKYGQLDSYLTIRYRQQLEAQRSQRQLSKEQSGEGGEE